MKYLIAAPQYTERSGGVMVLHDLCETLNVIGHNAAIIFFHNGNATEQNFEFAISNNPNLHKPGVKYLMFGSNFPIEVSDFIENGIIIYPDLINGNPLNGKRVVRYILNFNSRSFGSDYILSYSRNYHSSTHYTLYKVFNNEYIHDQNSLNWRKRTLNATYIGKGANFGYCPVIKDSILIERDWPKDKNQLGILLRQVKFFFTWDNISATNYDAVLCGCVPVFLSDFSASKNAIDQMELGAFPDISSILNNDEVLLKHSEDETSSTLNIMKSNVRRYTENWQNSVIGFTESCEKYFFNN